MQEILNTTFISQNPSLTHFAPEWNKNSWLDWRSWSSLSCKQPPSHPKVHLYHQAIYSRLPLTYHPSLAIASWVALLFTHLSFAKTIDIHSSGLSFYLKSFARNLRALWSILRATKDTPLLVSYGQDWQLIGNIYYMVNVFLCRFWTLTKWTLRYLSTSCIFSKTFIEWVKNSCHRLK